MFKLTPNDKHIRIKNNFKRKHAMGPQARNKCGICIKCVCLLACFLQWAAIFMTVRIVSILLTDLRPVLSMAPDWHIVHAQYILLNNEWTTPHHSSCLRAGQFLQVWVMGPQLRRMEQGRSWFPCRIWQQEKAEGLRDCICEHNVSVTAFRASCSGCLFSMLMGIWDQTWLNSFLSLRCTIISGQKEASN